MTHDSRLMKKWTLVENAHVEAQTRELTTLYLYEPYRRTVVRFSIDLSRDPN
jgi:hypothetical protein